MRSNELKVRVQKGADAQRIFRGFLNILLKKGRKTVEKKQSLNRNHQVLSLLFPPQYVLGRAVVTDAKAHFYFVAPSHCVDK
jgi:hypothetical protein